MSTSVPRRAALAVIAGLAALGTPGCRGALLPAAVQPGASVPRVAAPRAGTGTVVGLVADSATGYPVRGVAVYFTSDSVVGIGPATPRRDLPSDTTALDGGFALRDIPPGRYTLATNGLDHHPVRRLVIVRTGEVDTLVLRPRRRGLP